MTTLDPKDHEAQLLISTGHGPGSLPVHPGDGEPATAEPAAPANEPPPETAADWGVNSRGWIVRVHNLTSQPVTPWHMASDMVHSSSRLIAPGATGTVVGKPDTLRDGHPASMSIDLRIDGWPNVLLVRRVGRSDAFTATVYGCDPWAFTFAEHRLNEPLTLAITSRTLELHTGRSRARARQWHAAPKAVFLVPAEGTGGREQEPEGLREGGAAAA
ncbi:hypothetical protein ABZW32_24445 [Streptomyces sp. NPDC004667]|uniref:hypothetical protein n=1 Tax=Streptomyces sp. NPDC004667 TaxID=3154285 RepID=UPI0033AB0D60